MSNSKRAGVMALAAAVLVAMFIALRPDDDPETAPTASKTPSATVGGSSDQPEDRAAEEPLPPPPPPLLRAGKTRKLVAERGDQVRFRVRSPEDEELHVHGYEVKRSVPAGKTITVRLSAELEGIFEIELHRSHAVVGRLEVRP